MRAVSPRRGGPLPGHDPPRRARCRIQRFCGPALPRPIAIRCGAQHVPEARVPPRRVRTGHARFPWGVGYARCVRCAHPVCAPGVRTRCAHPVCAPGVRTRCAHPVCAPGVRTRCAHPVCAPGVRTRCAHPAVCGVESVRPVRPPAAVLLRSRCCASSPVIAHSPAQTRPRQRAGIPLAAARPHEPRAPRNSSRWLLSSRDNLRTALHHGPSPSSPVPAPGRGVRESPH